MWSLVSTVDVHSKAWIEVRTISVAKAGPNWISSCEWASSFPTFISTSSLVVVLDPHSPTTVKLMFVSMC